MKTAPPRPWRWTTLGVVPTAAALFAALLYLNFALGYVYGLNTRAVAWQALCAIAGAAVLLPVPRRARTAAATGALLLGHFAVFADLTYFRYCGDMLSLRSLSFGTQLVEVAGSPLGMLRPRDAVLAITAVAAVLATRWIADRAAAEGEPALGQRTLAAAGTIALTLGVLAATLAPRTANYGLSQIWNRSQLAVRIGAAPYHLVEASLLLREALTPAPDAAEVATLVRWMKAKNVARTTAPTWGLAAGRNVIVLQLESFQTPLTIGTRVAGVPVTPNLDALRARTRYYPRMFTQIQGGGTSDAEFMAATSLYPLASGAVFVRASENRFPTALPAMLRERGYAAAVYSGYHNPHFWNASRMYPALGFGQFVYGPMFGPGETLGMGLSDHDFLARTAPRLAALPQPFYASVITMSGHLPLKGFASFGPAAFEQIDDPKPALYLKAAHYVDAQVGMFIAELERTGLWRNSIVMIYGDHPGQTHTGSSALTRLAGPMVTPLDKRRYWCTPLFIHVPGDDVQGEQSAVAGQVDMMPTVAHFLGVPTPGALGSSLVGGGERFIAFRDGSFVAGRTYHDAPTLTDWSLDTLKPVAAPPAYLKARVAEHLASSDMILRNDLLPQLTGAAPP